jgi:hypothetical protein
VIGRYISDLEKGDVLAQVSFVITSEEAAEIASGFGESSPWFHPQSGGAAQFVPPTAVQSLKTRLLKVTCPGGDGPHPKLITSYDARHGAPIPVDRLLTVSGTVLDRYSKRGRTYLRFGIELTDAETKELLVEYIDEQLLRFAPESSQ